MNARLTKESRNLRPAWISGLLIMSLFLLPQQEFTQIQLLALCFWVGCCLVAVTPFARDWSLGGLSLMMAQPISRATVWEEKLRAAVRALIPITLVFAAINVILLNGLTSREAIEIALGSAALAPVFAITIGFWISVRIGDPRAAIFLTLLAILVLIAIALLVSTLLQFAISPMIVGAMLVIGTAPWSYHRARRAFLQWEDYHPLGQEIAFNLHGATSRRTTGPFANLRALVSKELHLQQTNFIFIAGLLVSGYLIRLENYRWGALSMMCSLIALFGPALLGIGAVCEEHRLDIAPQQVTLPKGVKRQWWVKYLFVVTLGTLLGAVCIWASHTLVAANVHANTPLSFFKIGLLSTFMADRVDLVYAVLYLGAVAATTALGMAIAASMHRYVLSIVVATLLYVGCSLAAPFFTSWAFAHAEHFQSLHRHTELVVFAMGVFLLPVAIHFGIANLRRVHGGRHAGISIVLASLAAIMVAAASAHAIYLRSWEVILPREKSGPAILSQDEYASFLPDLRRGIAVDSQGRIWKSTFTRWWGLDPSFHLKDGRPIWKTAVASYDHYVALQTNGTLWTKGQEQFVRAPGNRVAERGWKTETPEELRQLGSDSDWTTLSGNGLTFLAIKRDGSLWMWGTNRFGGLGISNRTITVTTPRRVDATGYWIQAAVLGGENFGLKRDGTLWRWGHWETLAPRTNGVHSVVNVFSKIPQLLTNSYSGDIREIRITPYWSRLMARLSDGRIVCIHHRTSTHHDFRALGDRGNSTILDPIFDWRAVSPNWWLGVGLTTNGRIIERTDRPMPALPEFVDSGSDWVSMDLFWGEEDSYYLGLKRDGSLWSFNTTTMPWTFYSKHTRLPPRWRPERMGQLPMEGRGAIASTHKPN